MNEESREDFSNNRLRLDLVFLSKPGITFALGIS